MLKVRNSTGKPNGYEIFFKGRKIGTGEMFDGNDYVVTDALMDFDFVKIAGMRAMDVPEMLNITMELKEKYFDFVDMLDFIRIGNGLRLSLIGGVNPYANEDEPHDWLLWNPMRFVKEMNRIAEAKGFGISKYDTDYESVELEFYFRIGEAETLDDLMQQGLANFAMVMKEAEDVLLQEAVKRRNG